eukprot:403372754
MSSNRQQQKDSPPSRQKSGGSSSHQTSNQKSASRPSNQQQNQSSNQKQRQQEQQQAISSNKQANRNTQKQHQQQEHLSVRHAIQLPQKLKFRFEQRELNQAIGGQTQIQPPQSQQNRRFKINMRLISESHKNKLSMRFQEIDRQFVCFKNKEERAKMGLEYDGIKLVDIYTKSNPNKVNQKYGKQLIMRLVFNQENQPTLLRVVSQNPDYIPPEIAPEDELEEEKLLDEQNLFQSLHNRLIQLQQKYNRTTEQISELFLRVCGDLDQVELALQGTQVPEWNYLEDMALTKSFETPEYQWLLKQKGEKEIEKRRKFLLTADVEDDQNPKNNGGDVDMKEEEGGQSKGDDESVSYI